MNTSAVQMPQIVRWIVAGSSVSGLVGLVLTFWFGFEDPNAALFSTSGVMVFAAPIAAMLHLTTTRGLTESQKRIWRSEFTSAEIWSALSEYLSSDDLGSSATRRAAEGDARTAAKKR
jgi:hypothetical protein